MWGQPGTRSIPPSRCTPPAEAAHPAIDAVVDVLEAGTLDPEAVQGIRIEVPPFLRPMICPDPVLTSETARMCFPVSIALLLEGRPLRPDDYLDHGTSSVRRRLATMSVHEIPTLTRPRLLVETPEQILILEREYGRGSSPHPFTSTDVQTKFRGLTQDRLDDRTADVVIAWISALDDRVAPPPPRLHAALARTFSYCAPFLAVHATSHDARARHTASVVVPGIRRR
ncbi:hypothetical protein AB0F44_24345 [Nocardioides sp. NPDC023903]|uniref:hypothetical protein n=1 Tax=Nocardioides sp. NPDC023903 TaxID=3157195 RepID=UPI0033D6C762